MSGSGKVVVQASGSPSSAPCRPGRRPGPSRGLGSSRFVCMSRSSGTWIFATFIGVVAFSRRAAAYLDDEGRHSAPAPPFGETYLWCKKWRLGPKRLKKSKVLRSGAVMRLRAARRTETAVLLPQTRLGTKGLRAVVQPSPAKRDCRSDIVRPASARLLAWLGGRCRRPLNTSVVEDINNTIKVIKRRANGYGDEKYLFLKIRAAFPGNPRGARNLPVSPCNSYTPISTGSLNAQHSTDCYEPTR